MSTDFRALCAELLQFGDQAGEIAANEGLWPDCDPGPDWLLDRARAALAQPEPVAPTDEEMLSMAASAIDPYESSGIAIGEYEPETQCAVEVYGSELIAYARAVLARWGTPANALPTPEATNA
jgi:hypothetical protein